jgi:conjugative transfer signal peptidase TraF
MPHGRTARSTAMSDPGPSRDLPLLAWGDAHRAAGAARRRVGRRIAIVGAVLALPMATLVAPPAPRLVWNASASAPLGLYGITYRSTIRRGSTVLAWPSPSMRRLAATRRYLPYNVPLIKRVAAVAGDTICAHGAVITIADRPVLVRQRRDPQGRAMPWWEGCHRLREREVFLLMDGSPLSFDGRYFGVTLPDQIIGKAHLIWAKPVQNSKDV